MPIVYPDGREEPLPLRVQEELDEFARECASWQRNVRDAIVMVVLVVVIAWLTGCDISDHCGWYPGLDGTPRDKNGVCTTEKAGGPR